MTLSMISGGNMPAPSEGRSIGELPSIAGSGWLGKSLWQAPKIEISKIADSDEVAWAFRDDVALDYEMMSPGWAPR